jgi:pyruvate kinase
VEIAIEKTPLAQKQIIRVCSNYRKPVIVATQMLESMHQSKQPTRAEASDVANAILDGADACMLSGETAIGEFPREAVAMMQRIMLETEVMFKGRQSRISLLDNLPHDQISDSIVYGAAQIGKRLDSELVVIASSTGEIARLKSKQRDYIHTICLTDDENVLKKLSLFWGIVPVRIDSLLQKDQLYSFVNQWVKSYGDGKPGDPIVMVSDTEWLPGIHDTIMVYRIA